MDLGFLGGFNFLSKNYSRLPFEITWANDLNPYACETYNINLDHKSSCGDAWELMGSMPLYADVLIGGFPCQDISVNGKKQGVSGARSGLYRAMVEAVRRLKPRVFVAENVKGLLMACNKSSLDLVLSDFKSLGYDVQFKLYNAADYGVPQTRERVIIVGTAPGVPKFTPPRAPLAKDQWITAYQALEDLEKSAMDSSSSHIWSLAKKSPEQGSRRLKANRPGHTMRAECHGNTHFHYKLNRRISMREAARIQSFPDNFKFSGGLRAIERQVGNAVPPVLAWHIAQSVLRCLESD